MKAENKPLKVISLGMGVQSVAMYYMSCMGEFPRADVAIMADPGGERTPTKQYTEFLLDWQKKNNGIEIIINQDKNLKRDLLNNENSTGQRYASIPAFTKGDAWGNVNIGEGMLRRQCTNEYKIEVVKKSIRKHLGLIPRQRFPEIEIWKGITADEMDRASEPLEGWHIGVYPFLNLALRRDKGPEKLTWGKWTHRYELYKWYADHNLPVPAKSGCTFCPYMNDAGWRNQKEKFPEDFAEAVAVDNAIRDSSQKGVNEKIYLHRSCKPLSEIDFTKTQGEIDFGGCGNDNCSV